MLDEHVGEARRVTEVIRFFFNDTATTEIYTLSLHDALPISGCRRRATNCSTSTGSPTATTGSPPSASAFRPRSTRSEEHTSELQSRQYLVCRLLLEKKKILHQPVIPLCLYSCHTLISHIRLV